jgi:hypothetical protein
MPGRLMSLDLLVEIALQMLDQAVEGWALGLPSRPVNHKEAL